MANKEAIFFLYSHVKNRCTLFLVDWPEDGVVQSIQQLFWKQSLWDLVSRNLGEHDLPSNYCYKQYVVVIANKKVLLKYGNN